MKMKQTSNVMTKEAMMFPLEVVASLAVLLFRENTTQFLKEM